MIMTYGEPTDPPKGAVVQVRDGWGAAQFSLRLLLCLHRAPHQPLAPLRVAQYVRFWSRDCIAAQDGVGYNSPCSWTTLVHACQSHKCAHALDPIMSHIFYFSII
jgi:hypothetical protein